MVDINLLIEMLWGQLDRVLHKHWPLNQSSLWEPHLEGMGWSVSRLPHQIDSYHVKHLQGCDCLKKNPSTYLQQSLKGKTIILYIYIYI